MLGAVRILVDCRGVQSSLLLTGIVATLLPVKSVPRLKNKANFWNMGLCTWSLHTFSPPVSGIRKQKAYDNSERVELSYLRTTGSSCQEDVKARVSDDSTVANHLHLQQHA